MKFPFRRKPLSLILCCTFAGALAVGYAAAARAQGTAPFRVDPRLLDLPPLKPAPAAVEASPEPKRVGRNDACPCGSGKKFKHCHYPQFRSEMLI